MAKHLTTREADYSKWYNELVVKADLAQNSGVRGSMVIKPYGFAIWEYFEFADLMANLSGIFLALLIYKKKIA